MGKAHFSRCGGKTNADDICVCGVNMHAVYFQENQHDKDAYSLVSVHKGVVCNQRVTEARRLFLGGGIKLPAAKGSECRLQGAIQKSAVSYIWIASRLCGDEAMKAHYLVL